MILSSIIIPTLNRQHQLRDTLYFLSKVDSPKDIFEIIIIDNGSIDETKLIVKEFIKENTDIQVKYLYDDTPGLLTGRHKGAEVALGEILTFIDDDVQVTPGWLKSIIDVFHKNDNIHFLTGPCLPYYEEFPPNWLKYFWDENEYGSYCGWLSLLNFGDSPKEINPNFVWGLNFSVRKSTFEYLGGFHPDSIAPALQCYQGDGETGLTQKAIERGIKGYYHPGVMLFHHVTTSRMTLEYFEKRAFFQGICDSFSSFRSYSPRTQPPKNRSFLKNKLNNLSHRIKAKIQQKEIIQLPKEIINLKVALENKRIDGYNFHQKAYAENPSVRAWVKKANYLDFKIPL
jgi:glycosyltransferase involved in cell wall biosynthesis